MAKQLIKWLLRRRLIKLTGIYSAITIQKVATTCGYSSVEETEAEIVSLVRQGFINAAIDAAKGVVMFGERNVLSDREVLGIITEKLRESMELSDTLRSWQMKLYSSKAYISRQIPRTLGEGSVQALPGEDYDAEFS